MSTFLIAIGVLVVGFSKTLPSQPTVKKILPWFFVPLGFHLSRTWLVVIIIAVADASGDLLLAKGMKQLGKIEIDSVSKILKQIYYIAINPTIISGICCQAIAFFAFILVLTWANISFVRPATALTYIFSLLGAKYLLKERVNNMRLVGIMFVGTGILLHR